MKAALRLLNRLYILKRDRARERRDETDMEAFITRHQTQMDLYDNVIADSQEILDEAP